MALSLIENERAWRQLAAAIVLQAVKDHYAAKSKLWYKENRDDVILQGKLIETEEFFASGWFEFLSEMDCTAALEKVNHMTIKERDLIRDHLKRRRANKR